MGKNGETNLVVKAECQEMVRDVHTVVEEEHGEPGDFLKGALVVDGHDGPKEVQHVSCCKVKLAGTVDNIPFSQR